MANERNQNRGLQETAQLIENRAGVQPCGVVFDINNRMIENSLLEYFKENGVDPDAEDVVVRVIWNREYVIERNQHDADHNQGKDPLKIIVYTDSKRKKNRDNGGKHQLRVFQQLQARLDQDAAGEINLVGRDKLNQVVARFGAETKKSNGHVKWHESKKSQTVSCMLDCSKVLNYVFSIDRKKRETIISFLTKRSPKDNRTFIARVLVRYNVAKFKKRRDPLAEMHLY